MTRGVRIVRMRAPRSSFWARPSFASADPVLRPSVHVRESARRVVRTSRAPELRVARSDRISGPADQELREVEDHLASLGVGLEARIREHVARTNEDLPESARIRRFLLLHKELDADDAELTRTRKVRRGFVAERYAELVGGLYGDGDEVITANQITYQDGSTAEIRTTLRIETMA